MASTTATSPEEFRLDARIPVRCLLHIPDRVGPDTLLILALHGYGSNPEVMLRLTVPTVGPEHIVASLQAPNQHYLAASPATAEIGYNWGTRQRGDDNIRVHHALVIDVLTQLRDRFQIPVARTFLMGFSQPVGLNYRFIGTHPAQAGGVIGICGGVPKDWEAPKYHPTPPLLHISRDQDEFFPVATVQGFEARLRHHASDVEFHLLPGGHRFPSKARDLVKPWLTRVLTGARS
ncbi:MAG: hypothetical protein ABI823_12005 [Bryobacteraceae bacterium]